MLLVPQLSISAGSKGKIIEEQGDRNMSSWWKGRHSILSPLTWLGASGVNCQFSLPQLPFHGSQFLHLSNEGPGWNQISRSLSGVEVLRAWEPLGVAQAFFLLCFPPPRDALAGGPEFQAGEQVLELNRQYTSRSFWYCTPLFFRGQELGRARGSGL